MTGCAEELDGALEGGKAPFSKHPLKIMTEKAEVKLIGKQRNKLNIIIRV